MVAVGLDPGKDRRVSLGEVLECAVMYHCGNLLLRELVDLYVLGTWDTTVNRDSRFGIFIGIDIGGLMPQGKTGANLLCSVLFGMVARRCERRPKIRRHLVIRRDG